MISANIIADSLGPHNDRLTTYVLTYPRFIHSELMTHRVFSRNAASSRAIPFKKMAEEIKENPFVPVAFQGHHTGMQGTTYLKGGELASAIHIWKVAAERALDMASDLYYDGVTKQLANRLVEPFVWYQSIVTASEYDNFFELRCPVYTFSGETYRSIYDTPPHIKNVFDKPAEWIILSESPAEIHIQLLAEAMWDARKNSQPTKLSNGDWHIPFGDLMTGLEENNRIKVATARAARISYATFGKNPEINFSKDILLHDKLLAMKHMSPFEHVARCMSWEEYRQYGIKKPYPNDKNGRAFPGWCRNFKGFVQYREIIENQTINANDTYSKD